MVKKITDMILAVIVAAILSACASDKAIEVNATTPTIGPQTPVVPGPPPASQALNPVTPAPRLVLPVKPHNSSLDPRSMLSKRSIYYDFDSAEIKA
jgi:hypothetical protein